MKACRSRWSSSPASRSDRRFRVEGAPAEVVKRVLDPVTRAYLLGEVGIELRAHDGRARLVLDRWVKDANDARPAIELLRRFAASVRSATLALDEGLAAEATPAAPYRDEVHDDRLQEARAEREAEVAHVAAVRARRMRQAWIRALGVGVVLVLILATLCTVQR